MEKKKKIALIIPNCILILAALVLECYALAMFEADGLVKGVIVCSVVALLAVFAYVLLGYTKKAAGLYKIFMVLFLLSSILALVESARYDVFSLLPLLLGVVVSAILVVLTFWANVGKKGSFILSALLLVCEIVLVLWSMLVLPNIMPAIQQSIFFNSLAALVMALTAGVMVLAKYADKAARGRD